MGTTGARGKSAGREASPALEQTLAPLGMRTRAMFGGHGLFKDDVMFAIVDSEGRLYLRADSTSAAAFEAAGPTEHAGMPYWEVAQPIREVPGQLHEWAARAAEVAATARH